MVTVGHKRNMAGVLYRHILPVLALGGFLIWPIQPSAHSAESDTVSNWALDEGAPPAEIGRCRIAGGRTHQRVESRHTNGFIELAKVGVTPKDNTWIEIPVNTREVYRYVKVEAARGALLAVAEIEFFAADHKLAGTPFGTDTGSKGKDHDAGKAFDGDSKTAFKAPITEAYVGLDLGSDSMTSQPGFLPGGGPYDRPQSVTLNVWPPGPTVRCTTDGSTPSRTHGQIFKPGDKISVDRNTSLAAMAYQEGKADSNVVVASYLIGAGQTLPPRVKTYHIGNSLTDTVKGVLDVVALSGGKNLLTQFKTIPGCSIIGNWQANGKGFGYPDAATNDYEKVLAAKVDHLFLQPFPNPPGLWRDGEHGDKFIALARQANPDVQPWLYAQWVEYPPFDKTGRLTAAYCGQIGGQSWDPEEKNAWVPPIPAVEVKAWDDAMTNTMAYYRDPERVEYGSGKETRSPRSRRTGTGAS